jgi:hypothetical protein
VLADAELHEVLASNGDPVPVPVRMGIPLQGLSQQDDVVTVDFDNAPNGSYDLVIGADGIHSTVRRVAFGSGSVQPVGQLAWRFVTECPPEVTAWTVLLGRDVTFLAVPIGNGQVYCCCDTSSKSTPRLDGDEVHARLAELLAGFAAPVPAILESLKPGDSVHVSPIEEVELNAWSRGSVLLIGDAAMQHLPTWPKARRWPSKTASYPPSASPRNAASPGSWDNSRLGVGPARGGSSHRRIAGTALAIFLRSFATWCCGGGDGEYSMPPTGPCWNIP